MNGTVNIPAIAGAIEVTLCMSTPGSVTAPALSLCPAGSVAVPMLPGTPPGDCDIVTALPCSLAGHAVGLALAACCCVRAHELLVRLLRFQRFVHDRTHGADHRFGVVALED